MSSSTIDDQLRALTVQAGIAAARLDAHVAACGVCQGLSGPSGASCPRRHQLERALEARRALGRARQRALQPR